MEALDELTRAVDRATARINGYPSAHTSRAVGALLALPSGTVLGLARWLTPSPKGFGTHTQLGLGECVVMQLTGWPCPMCGMTTTFALLAHLRPLDAFLNQPFGPVLFALTVFAFGLGVADLISGASLYRRVLRWVGPREQVLAIGLLVGMIGGWLYKGLILHPALLGG